LQLNEPEEGVQSHDAEVTIVSLIGGNGEEELNEGREMGSEERGFLCAKLAVSVERGQGRVQRSTYDKSKVLNDLESKLDGVLVARLKRLRDDADDSRDQRLERSLRANPSISLSAPFPPTPPKPQAPTYDLRILATLDKLGKLPERPDTPHAHAQALGIGERLAQELHDLRDVVGDASSWARRGDDQSVEQHEDGLKRDLAVGGVVRGGETPEPWEQLRPCSLGELNPGEGRDETDSRSASLTAGKIFFLMREQGVSRGKRWR
jgi:hypothetical protein